MKKHQWRTAGLLLITVIINQANAQEWALLDDFQQFGGGEIFTDPTEIGWHGSSPDGTDEYWMVEDPYDPDNIAMYVESVNYGVGWEIWCQKLIPGGGIPPGDTGTLFLRCLWLGFDNNWHIGTADKELDYDPVTGKQTSPGAWGDYNALVRLGLLQNLEHRDGAGYVSTNPPQVLESNVWYSFWIVVENTWDSSTTPQTSTGVYTLYVQGPGIGDGISPTLIPVGTDPPRDKAYIRRAPVDADGNPQSIIWFQFATLSGPPNEPNAGDPFLLDDIAFSFGKNLSMPASYVDLGSRPARPTDLEAAILSDSEIQLTWEDNATDEIGYKVYMRLLNDSDWTEIADVPTENLSSFLVSDLDARKQYSFKVHAYSDELTSLPSNFAFRHYGNPIFQGAEAGGEGWWSLDWFGQYLELEPDWVYHKELGLFYIDGEEPDGFFVYCDRLECWFWTTSSVFSYFYKYGPYPGWYYYYPGAANDDRWFARLSDGTYVRAPYINKAVPQPAAPSNLEARAISPSSVYLSWDDNAEYEVGCRIFMRTGDSGEWNEAKTVWAKNLSFYSLSGVDTSQQHEFKIQAIKYGSDSTFSNVAMQVAKDEFETNWLLVDDFQQFNDFNDWEVFLDATEIGWHASSEDQTDEYWLLTDPYDDENITLYVEAGSYGTGYGTVWCQKELPDGGIPPGETGTVFIRSLWDYFNNWHIGTADKPLEFDPLTGLQTAPGAWGDFNALVRLGVARNIEHRDGGGYVSTDPPITIDHNAWYSFWLVVENTWDMSTSPPTSTGVYTLYAQGSGIGDGVSPTLIPVGTDPPKDKAFLRRAPVDAEGNPQSIIWFQFATESSAPGSPSAGGPTLLDDIYFSHGENITLPPYGDL